jgi:DNA-binding NarL/FixJ family response regulator
MIRVVLVDDEPAVRRGLKMRLELTKERCVVGETGDGTAALPLIRQLDPDVVVMDVELPGRDGICLTGILRAENKGIAIVILSMHDDAETRTHAHAAGADKFVSKHEGTDALLQAIREAVAYRQTRGGHAVEKENGSNEEKKV